jgi:hypothetical protein
MIIRVSLAATSSEFMDISCTPHTRILFKTLTLSFCSVTAEWVFADTRSDVVATQGESDDKELYGGKGSVFAFPSMS